MDILSYTRLPALLALLPFIALLISRKGSTPKSEPPRLGETIPFVSNTWQFITNKEQFMNRVR
jgi:hypothetical protein